MIDFLTMVNKKLTEPEQLIIIEKNNLRTNSKGGFIYYDNANLKFSNGFYLRIDSKQMQIQCSLHKYFNHVLTGKQTNFDLFSFSNAVFSIEQLSNKTGIDIKNLKVTNYEIGLNLFMDNDCLEYINNVQTIGTLNNKKEFFINPKYKDKRIKTTVFHRNIKKSYKIYDKVYEMIDKGRTDTPTDYSNILRIETTHKRVENMTVFDLMQPKTIKRLTDQFLKEWRTVQFTTVLKAPKGTRQQIIELTNQILFLGKREVLELYQKEYKKGNLTERRYRTIREFIVHEWDTFKTTIEIKKQKNEYEFRNKLNEALKITSC